MSVGRAWSYGEVSPSLQKRVDLDSYARSAALIENFQVMREGGLSTRPGTTLVAPTKFSTTADSSVRLVPFIFNSGESNVYVIEVGHQYMRFHKNGAQIRQTGITITGISKALPGVVSYSGADPTDGDEVYISGVVGMEEINGAWFKVASVDGTANTFVLKDRLGNNYDTTNFTTYASGGTFQVVYEIVTTYDEDDIFSLSFAQLNDVVSIAGGLEGYAPYTLTRSSDTSWALAAATFSPSTTRPTIASYSYSNGSSNQYTYKVTCIDATSKQESLPGTYAIASVSAVTAANPGEVTTSANHVLLTGDRVTFSSVGGMTELNGNTYTITKTAADKFTLGVDTSAYTAYTAGGLITTDFLRTVADATAPSSSNPITLQWSPVSGALQYVVYKQTNGVFAFIGVSDPAAISGVYNYLTDVGQTPDTDDTVMIQPTVFSTAGTYPYCVAYAKQRLWWGGFDSYPNRVMGSRSGDYNNFGYHEPLQADDAITMDLVGDRAQIVRSIKEIAGRAIAFCSEGEFGLGDQDGVIDATSPDARQFSGHGSTVVPPLLVNEVATYIQARSSQVRDFGYSFEDNGYKGEERSIRSSHLFKGHTIVDWCYQQVPNSNILAVRDDGIILGCTYVREERMAAWWRMKTYRSGVNLANSMYGAKVESIASVPEGTEDAVYVVVERASNTSVTRKYIERLASRLIVPTESETDAPSSSYAFPDGGIADYIGLDCAVTYDGRNSDSTTYMRFNGGESPYDESHTLSLISCDSVLGNKAYFSASDVGKAIFVYSPDDGSMVKFTIEAYTNSHLVTGHVDRTVPSYLTSNATNTWSKAVNKIYGLGTFDSYAMAVLGDGFVEATPMNNEYSLIKVATSVYNGVVLGHYYERVAVGTPFMCSFKALDIDSVQVPGGGLIHKKKVIDKLYVAVEETRGLYVGSDEPEDDADDPLENLTPLVDRRANDFTYDDPQPLTTDVVDQDCVVGWDSHGRVFIRQVDPLPACLLAVMPDGYTVI